MSAALGRRTATRCLLAVLAATALLFAPTLGNGFAHDDRLVAKAVRDTAAPNAMVHELQSLARYFSTPYWQGVDDRDLLFRPVTILSYALVYAGAGRPTDEAREAWPQHALNVVLHLLAVWLTYRVLRAVRAPRAPALLAAGVFGVHALHSEVVAGVVGRAELLAFVGGALGTLLVVHGSVRGRALALLGGAVAWFMAFGSKESAVAWAPFAGLVLFVHGQRHRADPARRLGGGAWLRLLAAAVVPLALFLLLREGAVGHVDRTAWSAGLERSTQGYWRSNAVVQWAYALGACVLPWHLSADHGAVVFTPTQSMLEPGVLAALCLLSVVGCTGLAMWRRRPLWFLAAAAFFGHSALTANVLLRIGTDYAERLYYTPSLALSFAVAAAAMALPARERRACAVPLALWVAWNALLVVQRHGVWRDNATLYAHEVVNQPRSARMHLLHAAELEKRGELAAMVPHLEKVVALFPQHAQAWNHLGADHLRANRAADARVCFERSVSATYFVPRERVDAAINLVAALLALGDTGALAAPLDLALRFDPQRVAERVPDLRRHLRDKLPYEWFDDYLGRVAAAVPQAQPWAYHRAWLAYDSKRYAAAVAHCRTALPGLRSQPQAGEMAVLLASSLASVGDKAEARRIAEAVAADATAPDALRTNARELLRRLQ